MDTTKLLLDLFGRLAEFLGDDYGVRLTLAAEAGQLTLKVATQKAVGRYLPSFVLTVRPEAGELRVGYRPEGQPPARPERRSVRGDRPGADAALFDLVRGFVEAERARLVECRQGR